jgi:hypothetical protein
MTTIQIPPSGTPADFPFDIPAPDGMSTLGGVKLMFSFTSGAPDLATFGTVLEVAGTEYGMWDTASGPTTVTRATTFSQGLAAPASSVIHVNSSGALQPGDSITIYAWGAQTESGKGVLNPDDGGEPTSLSATVEVGTVQVLDWTEWNRITGANQGEAGS